MPGFWDGSNRKDTLPKNWVQIRKQILARDGNRCQAVLESTGWLCGELGNQVDHIDRFGSQTDPNNLQVLCEWHHARKSSAEGAAARAPRITNARPKKKHPGLIDPPSEVPPF